MTFHNTKLKAFSLFEVLVCLGLITALYVFITLKIDPDFVFAYSRNMQRSNDLQAIQAAMNKYLSETEIDGQKTYLSDFTGYASLYASAIKQNQQPQPDFSHSGRCPDGEKGLGLDKVIRPYDLDITGSRETLFLTNLMKKNYFKKVPKDPQTQTPYKASIDTINVNHLILYAPHTEGKDKFIAYSVSTLSPIVVAWDSFDRPDDDKKIGKLDTGQSWEEKNVSGGIKDGSAYFPNATSGAILPFKLEGNLINYSIFLQVSNLSAVGKNAGLIFRYKDESNYCYFFIKTIENFNLGCIKDNKDVFKSSSNSFPSKSNDVLKVIIDSSNNINFFVNDNKIYSINSSYLSDSFDAGLYMEDNLAKFDNFLISRF